MSATSTINILKERLQKALKEQDLDDSSTIESCQDCLQQLDKVDMTLAVLTETLIGATVSKFKSHDTLGTNAKELIKKWKKIAKQQENGAAAAGAEAKFVPDSEWAELPEPRQAMCNKFYPLLGLVRNDLIQAGMNADAIDPSLARLAVEIEAAIHDAFGSDRKAYNDKARSIAFNLKKNHQLSTDLVFGAVQADELVKMNSEQLASDEQRKQIEEQTKKLIDSKRLDWEQANEDKINKMCGIKGELLKASLFTCGRCKSTKTTSTQKQTRSADEPMTVFVFCMNCGNRWKFS